MLAVTSFAPSFKNSPVSKSSNLNSMFASVDNPSGISSTFNPLNLFWNLIVPVVSPLITYAVGDVNILFSPFETLVYLTAVWAPAIPAWFGIVILYFKLNDSPSLSDSLEFITAFMFLTFVRSVVPGMYSVNVESNVALASVDT